MLWVDYLKKLPPATDQVHDVTTSGRGRSRERFSRSIRAKNPKSGFVGWEKNARSERSSRDPITFQNRIVIPADDWPVWRRCWAVSFAGRAATEPPSDAVPTRHAADPHRQSTDILVLMKRFRRICSCLMFL